MSSFTNAGIPLGQSRGVRHGVEGVLMKVWVVVGEFIRPSHDIVLRRNSGLACSGPIQVTTPIRLMRTMWCSRPTSVGGLHHRKSQPQATPFKSGKRRRLLHIVLL